MIYLDNFHVKTTLYDKLTDAHATFNTKSPFAVVYQHDTDFSPIAFVNGSRAVQYRHGPLAGQPAPRPYFSLRPGRQLDGNTGWYYPRFCRRNHKVTRGVQIKSGISRMRIFWQHRLGRQSFHTYLHDCFHFEDFGVSLPAQKGKGHKDKPSMSQLCVPSFERDDHTEPPLS